MGAVVDEMQAWVQEQLHWLKGDTSSLETLSESEETAPGDLFLSCLMEYSGSEILNQCVQMR